MKFTSEKQLRESIRSHLGSLLSQAKKLIKEEAKEAPAGDDISNAELAKGLKTGAADIAGSIPAKLNDDFADMMKSLAAMAQYDKSKFMKIKSLISQFDDSAMKKAEK